VAEPVDTLVEYLRTAKPLAVVRNPTSGANETYIVSLEGGVAIVAKYGGPHPNIKQEAAAWVMARLLGWEDMVAVTVLSAFRPSQGHEIRESSLQVAWHPHEVGPDLDSLPAEDVWRGALFDAIVMHRDRHPNNWLACPPVASGEPRLKLIDHGHTWDTGGQPSSRIYEKHQGKPIPNELRTALGGALRRVDRSPLPRLIDGAAVEAVRKRLTFVLQSETLGVP
jgi:hypothetical protein